MIEQITPPGAVAAEAFDDPAGAFLFPAEEALMTSAVEKRRREFATGRHLARRALSGLDVPPAALLPGPHREPLWPAGVVGSITHCPGYRAAMVARQIAIATLGIDAEPDVPLPPKVLGLIALAQERDRLAALRRAQPRVHWDRLLFSAKESVFKSWYPLARRWLDFHGTDITIDPRRGTFHARLLVPAPALPDGQPLTGFDGRWLAQRGLLLSAVAVPRIPGPRQIQAGSGRPHQTAPPAVAAQTE